MNYETSKQEWCRRRKEIAAKVAEKVPIRHIAQEYGISTQRVYEILKKKSKKVKKKNGA